MNSSSEPIEFLLVEEDRTQAEQALAELRRARILNPVRVAHHPDEAIFHIFGDKNSTKPRNVPGLIFINYLLPGMHGLDLLRHIKSDQRTREIPVIMAVSNPEEEIRVLEHYRTGATCCLLKPYRDKKFFELFLNLKYGWALVAEDSQV